MNGGLPEGKEFRHKFLVNLLNDSVSKDPGLGCPRQSRPTPLRSLKSKDSPSTYYSYDDQTSGV